MNRLLKKMFGYSVSVHPVPDERYSVDLSGWVCGEVFYVVKKYLWGLIESTKCFMTKEGADKYKTYLENK